VRLDLREEALAALGARRIARLPARGEAEQRALARAFKRLASVVQVIQVVTTSAPWAEHAAKSFEL